MTASVSTPVFEGPIDLLLQLVNSHEVELYDVPLAAVVDAFVAEVAGWESVDLQTLSEFLMVASVLIELKSRRLLPGPDDIDTDEELVGWEERDLLLARLPRVRSSRPALSSMTTKVKSTITAPAYTMICAMARNSAPSRR